MRGIVPDELNEEAAYRIGNAFADWSNASEVVVGRDARLSSPSLTSALIRGLCEGGVSVRDIGLVTTPMLNFAVAKRQRHGLMVTASHNPSQYNGIKVIDPRVEQVYYGAGLEELERRTAAAAGRAGKQGRAVIDSTLADYAADLAAHFSGVDLRKLSLIIDCSNGVGSIPLAVLERFGVHYRLINHVPDGSFPNHGPDTLRPENLQQLQGAVREERADVGVMFDGDADRVRFVDERGEIVPLDMLFLILAQDALSQRRGTVFYDLRFSKAVKEEVEKLGGKPVMMRVGNPFYKAALHNTPDAVLGAELSGHIMYRDHYAIDDPLYATLQLLSALRRSEGAFSERWRNFVRYAKSEEIRIETTEPLRLIETAKRRFSDGRISEVDGVTIEYPDFWFNLRGSNTEPVAKLVIEAASPADLELRKQQALSELGMHSETRRAGMAQASASTTSFHSENQQESLFDPVCKMPVNPTAAPAHTRFNAKDYYFCSISCMRKFERGPHKYTEAPANPEHRR